MGAGRESIKSTRQDQRFQEETVRSCACISSADLMSHWSRIDDARIKGQTRVPTQSHRNYSQTALYAYQEHELNNQLYRCVLLRFLVAVDAMRLCAASAGASDGDAWDDSSAFPKLRKDTTHVLKEGMRAAGGKYVVASSYVLLGATWCERRWSALSRAREKVFTCFLGHFCSFWPENV